MKTCPHCGKPLEDPPRISWNDQLERWNDLAKKHGLRRIQLIGKTRAARLRARLHEYGPEYWDQVERALQSLNDFARDKGFVDFDFVTKAESCHKLLEGRYSDPDVPYVEGSDGVKDTTPQWYREDLKAQRRAAEPTEVKGLIDRAIKKFKDQRPL